MKRVMALDIGEKRTGIAFNQGGSIAFPYRVLEGKGDIDALLDIARELGAEEIVIGFPLRDGSIGEKAKQIETLKERIEKVFPGKVVLWDERFSTREAEKRLIEAGVRRRKRKGTTDQLSATLILQTYLDREGK